MSFFGYDTTLPRDRPSGNTQSFFETPDPFAGVSRSRVLESFRDDDDDDDAYAYSWSSIPV
jgi:DNA topoisomerase 2-associated protein PAT1